MFGQRESRTHGPMSCGRIFTKLNSDVELHLLCQVERVRGREYKRRGMHAPCLAWLVAWAVYTC